MISKLLNKLRKQPQADVLPGIPEEQRIYCIGDIHGRADLVEQIHEKVCKDSNGYDGEKTVLYLGDYIDRGEQSRQVLELLLTGSLAGFKTIYLRGNHEQTMLDFIESPEAAAAWLSFGGRETLNSYGIPVDHIPTQREIPSLAEKLKQALPADHLAFLQNCTDSWQCGSYYFVHAGIRPGVALDKQAIEDQLWIRDEFHESQHNHGAIVVHGHSIAEEPQFLPNRIGIDTGAYSSGILTCLVLEGNEQRLLQTNTNK